MYYNHIPRSSHVLLSVLGTCINYKAPTTTVRDELNSYSDNEIFFYGNYNSLFKK